MPVTSLEDRTAIVTGASSGIGRETARALAREGADVTLSARREERLEELAADIEADYDVRAHVVPADLREEAAAEALVGATVEEFGGLDVLVNNIGVLEGSDVDGMATDQYRTMLETNVDGYFFPTRAALPHLKESAGHCIFVGSFAGEYPRPFNPIYAGTKWFVRGFAQSLAAQVGEAGVGVSVVNPSEVRTEFESLGETIKERMDEGEAIEPEEVAEGIVFVARQDDAMVADLDLYRRDKFSHF